MNVYRPLRISARQVPHQRGTGFESSGEDPSVPIGQTLQGQIPRSERIFTPGVRARLIQYYTRVCVSNPLTEILPPHDEFPVGLHTARKQCAIDIHHAISKTQMLNDIVGAITRVRVAVDDQHRAASRCGECGDHQTVECAIAIT